MEEDVLGEQTRRERDDSIPHTDDPDRVFQVKKARLMGRVLPMTLIPLSSANGMLVIGSGLKNSDAQKDCYFPLMEYLIIGGAVSLSMVVMAVASKHILEWILFDKIVTRVGSALLKALRYMGMLLAFLQVGIIVVGTALLFPEMSTLSYDKHDPHYCAEGPVVFTFFIISMCWVFALFAAVCYVYIHYFEGYRRRRVRGIKELFARRSAPARGTQQEVAEVARSTPTSATSPATTDKSPSEEV